MVCGPIWQRLQDYDPGEPIFGRDAKAPRQTSDSDPSASSSGGVGGAGGVDGASASSGGVGGASSGGENLKSSDATGDGDGSGGEKLKSSDANANKENANVAQNVRKLSGSRPSGAHSAGIQNVFDLSAMD